jgi:hypothetical protein
VQERAGVMPPIGVHIVKRLLGRDSKVQESKKRKKRKRDRMWVLAAFTIKVRR